jgi:hypothetical protein
VNIRNFDERTERDLLEMVREFRRTTRPSNLVESKKRPREDGQLMMTDVDGIPGAVGDELGKAECKLMAINDDGTVNEVVGYNGEPVNLPVYNTDPRKIVGETLIQIKQVAQRRVVDHPFSGSAIFYTPSGGIPGRSGETLGQASCSRVYKTGASISTSEDSESVTNLSTEPVGGEVYIQALWIEDGWVANWEQCD